MNHPDPSLLESARTDRMIDYTCLDVEFTGAFKGNRPVLEPVLREGLANIVTASPGIIVSGTLLDCPESKRGCVVVDTGAEALAVQSHVLTGLRIEHAPGCLEFIAIPLEGWRRKLWWDWEAYEVAPDGQRILVSTPHCEVREASADEWLGEIRDVILPALQTEIGRLEAKEKHLHQEWKLLSLLNPSSEAVLEAVTEQFFGADFRQAKQMLRGILLEPSPGPQPSAQSGLGSGADGRLDAARSLLEAFQAHVRHPALCHELDLRIQDFWTRHAQLRALLERTQVARSRLSESVEEGHTLLGKLDALGKRLICMRRSTLAASRHLSLPDELTVV